MRDATVWCGVFACAGLAGCIQIPLGDGSGGERIFADDFDAQQGWAETDDFGCRRFFSNGRYIVEVNSGGKTSFAPHADILSAPFGVATDAELLRPSGDDNASASVLIERLDRDNRTFFWVDAFGWYKVSEIRDGISRDLTDWRSSRHLFEAGSPNELRINRYSDRIEIFANGRGVQTLETTALVGDVQVGVGSTTFRDSGTSSAAFEYFDIYELPDEL